MNFKVLFFCRKNDKFSELCKLFLFKKFKTVKVIETNKSKKNLNLLKWRGDLILLFRSKIILPEEIINRAKIACVNFHPSTPKYRGIGGINYAIYNNDNFFGCTAHLITDKKIDCGPILNVRRFKIKKNINLSNLLKVTHKNLYLQFKNIVPKLVKKEKISELIYKSKNEHWSNTYNNKKKLDDFYNIKLNDKNLQNKIRATYLNNIFAPYYFLNKRKIKLTDAKIKKILKNE